MRRKRVESFYEHNNVCKRIEWLREKTGLTHRHIVKMTGIPKTTYVQMESSSRTTVYEYLYILSNFYNTIWEKKYTKSYPLFNNKEVKEITLEWLMFGHNATIDTFIKKISEIEKDFIIEQIQMLERQFELEKRLKELDNGKSGSHGNRDEEKERDTHGV